MIRIKTLPLSLILVAGIFGGIGIAKSVGYYETTSSKEPAKFKTGELAGLPNPADIRGSYTWLDLERVFGIPAAESAAAFSLPGHALAIDARVSELEEIYLTILPEGYEIGTGAVRLFVSLYTGLPLEAEEGSVLPDAALAYLATRPGIDAAGLQRYALPAAASQATEAQASAAQTPAIQPAATQPAAAPASQASTASATASPATASPASAAPATAVAPSQATAAAPGTGSGTGSAVGAGTGTGSGSGSGRAVVGKTTFGDLYDWGLSEAQVESVLGYKPGARSQTVRDSAAAAGKEFSGFRTRLQALVDQAAP
jgi:hypothetical protein